ncbi:hypothetical protein B0H16DRAFT_1822031 [Mycena metata]|uniref:Zinc finger PHD-type domain-containing protein n=1 Tax=Mycena metata TaxID=1033252 RepID=A0AAD7H069_9AGAR|nr:hypothetical protein B0H16DRAFT_1822031 [Mycena metata]
MSSSLPVSGASGAAIALPVVDDEGFVVCPECSERVNCGPAGINNFVKRHKPGVSQVCKTAKAKRDKKPRQDGKLSGWFTQRAPLVRSTVAVPAPIPPVNTPRPPVFPLPPPSINPASVPSRSSNTPQSLLDQFRAAIKTLPATVPEATDSDVLSIFGGDPAQVIDATVPANEIYEHLNPLFHTALGWNMSVEETAQVLRRGHWGLDGLLRFITYFVTQRGVREQDFRAKIQQILDAINFLTPTAPPGIVTDLTIVPTAAADDEEIEFISHTPAPILSRRCNGFIFPLKQKQTISDAYPIQMHDKGGLPWDFGVRRQVLYLTAHSCAGTRRPGLKNCGPCANLVNHNMLKGIINRSADGVHENANLLYQPTTALIGITRNKSFVIQNLRLGVLNNSRKLLTQTKSLSDYKRLVVAIGSGDVKRVDRVIAVCVKQKRGIRGVLDAYLRAAKGLWKPANTEEEDMFGLAMLKLAGVRVTEIAHRALGLPGITTLRNRMITPPLTASPGAPQVKEIQKNIEACFGGIVDALAAKKVHAHHVGLEFNGEWDLDELLDALKKKPTADGKLDSLVHNAGEVTVAAVGIMSEDTRLCSARPILISGDCKRESGVEHSRKVLTPVLRALEGKKELTDLRTICLASDGETRRGTAFMIKTWKHTLPSTSSIHKLLKDLKFMNFMVGDDDLTGDKDPKHVHKRLRNGIIRERGIRVLGIDLTPGIIRTHFQSAGHNVDHIRSVFNPEDKQDVRLAFDMLKDIWSLPPCPVGTHPGISAAREALRTLGKLLFHFVSPYICVDYSLSEQLEHLSAAAHLALALFRRDGKHFMASLLYTDIMIIIKNFLKIIPATTIDDPSSKHDWKSAGSLGHTLKVPGKMVQCLDPTLSTARIGHPYYLFESSALRILTASFFEQLTPQKRLLVPSVNSSKFYPYREGAGRACFVCERDNNSRDFDVPHTCPRTMRPIFYSTPRLIGLPSPVVSASVPPAPAWEFYVSATGKAKVISARTKCPNSAMHFRYSTAVKSTESAPSSNVPLNCTLCPTASIAPWRYNFLHHLQSLHPTAPADKYATIWELDSDEVKRLKKVWENITRGVPIPRKREPKHTALVLSEAHNSRLSMRETVVHFTDLERPAPMDESDDEDTSPAPLMQQLEVPQSAAGEKSVTPAGLLDEHVAGNIDSERARQAFDELAESSFPFLDTETLPFLDDAPTPPPADQLITPVSPAVVEFGRGKRKRPSQNLKALEQCLCGNPVSEDDTEKIKCNRNGCETVWYHLPCVRMEDSVHYWTCEACASSAGGSRLLKRTRRV